jgi:glycosyltransferase involved in cell wall biosynthesis
LNIWLIQSGEPLPIQSGVRKMRTALLAEKLLERRHTVCWWSSAFEHQRKVWISERDKNFQIRPEFAIHVLRGTGYKKNFSFARYIDHRIVALKFKIQSKNYPKPDVIIASMPCYHLAYESMIYAQRNNIPLLVDIRDLWPDIFLHPLKNSVLCLMGRFALALDFAKLTRLLRKAKALVAISNGCLEWGLKKIGRSSCKWDRVFYHGYKKKIDVQPDSDSPNNLIEFKEKKIFLFVGTFGESYELRLILEVAKRFYNNGRNDIIFYLPGTGEQYESLKKESADLPFFFLPGWVEEKDLAKLLYASWAGIVPCRSIENAAPNKVFEYLSAGLPLISSLEGEIAQLIVRHNMGLNYRPGDAEGLYQNIHKLALDSDLRKKMSANASQFFEKYGNADKIYDEYAIHVEKIAEHYKLKPGENSSL